MPKLDCLFLASCFFSLSGNRRAQEGGDGVKEDSEGAQGSAEGPSHLVQCRSYCFLSCLLFCGFLHFEPYPCVCRCQILCTCFWTGLFHILTCLPALVEVELYQQISRRASLITLVLGQCLRGGVDMRWDVMTVVTWKWIGSILTFR